MLHPAQPGPDELGAARSPEADQLSAQLSALLAEMVRAPEVALGPVVPGPAALEPGAAIGRFELVRELGRGGFGVVYEATDRELSRTVALKVVKAGTRIAARGSQWLLREAEAVARLNHPNIITLHDLGQASSGPYLVFELLRGKTLHEALRAGPLPLAEVLDVGLAVARALVHAHAAGVVHRDLTSGNVFLPEGWAGGGSLSPTTGRGHSPSNPEAGAVKVLDFGLAHLFGRDGANDGGTPAYMAPEQWEGDGGDSRTDLFALGVILFQSLTGRFPYKVEKGWSEALEPGRTPRLPLQAAPARLRRLVEALLERAPERRPEGARAVRDEILAIARAREGAPGKRVLWGLGALAAGAVALAGWSALRHEPQPGEQVHAVVAAIDNGAADPTLEAVPGLLAAALEPSPRVKVVPASRLAYASRQAGLGEPGKLAPERARSLARLVGAEVVLQASSWRTDGTPVLAVKAVESESGRELFSAQLGAGGRGGLAAAIDQLAERIRRELRERAEDRKLRRPVAESVTASAEAARWYYEGVECLGRRTALSAGPRTTCSPAFERALSVDPSFPLAHYQLAAMNWLPGDSGENAKPHLASAMAAVERLPAREAGMLRALAARVAGRSDEAIQIYDGLLAAAPEDAELLALARSVYVDRDDWASAARYLEKLVSVAPDQDAYFNELGEAFGRLNRLDDLSALIHRLEGERPRRFRPLVEAHLWAGSPARAVEVAREAVAERGDQELGTLVYALQGVAEYREMEEPARRLVAVTDDPRARRFVDVALVGQGRVAEALRWAEATESQLPRAGAAASAVREALLAAATREAKRVWPYAARAHALEPRNAADLAVVLALLGDMAHAEILARDLPPGADAARQYEALRVWRSGDTITAMALLARLEAENVHPFYGLAPSYLLAEVSADAGDDVGTVAAVERLERLPPDRAWRAWAYPRALFLAARARQRLGDVESARSDLIRLNRMLAHADPTYPLVKEIIALQKRF